MTTARALRRTHRRALLVALALCGPDLALAQTAPPPPGPAAPGAPKAAAARKKRPRKGKGAGGVEPASDTGPKAPPVDQSEEDAFTKCPGMIPPGKKFKLDFRGEIEL